MTHYDPTIVTVTSTDGTGNPLPDVERSGGDDAAIDSPDNCPLTFPEPNR